MIPQILACIAGVLSLVVLIWALAERLRGLAPWLRRALTAVPDAPAYFDPELASAVVWRDCSGCGRHHVPHEDHQDGWITCWPCGTPSLLTEHSED